MSSDKVRKGKGWYVTHTVFGRPSIHEVVIERITPRFYWIELSKRLRRVMRDARVTNDEVKARIHLLELLTEDRDAAKAEWEKLCELWNDAEQALRTLVLQEKQAAEALSADQRLLAGSLIEREAEASRQGIGETWETRARRDHEGSVR